MFIVNRHRRPIMVDGLSAADATARAVATAGSAVVFAGSTVIIALAGLSVIGIGFLTTMVLVAASTVALAVWGWFIRVVALDTPGPLLSFLPIMVTGILYGLAMDYQVFLVASIREAHAHPMPARRAIVHGFDHASRGVVAAAVIMVSVFAAFILSDDPMIKQLASPSRSVSSSTPS